MSGTHAHIESLETAFLELVKMLGRNNLITVTQLAATLETAATASKVDAESKAAFCELARKIRNP